MCGEECAHFLGVFCKLFKKYIFFFHGAYGGLSLSHKCWYSSLEQMLNFYGIVINCKCTSWSQWMTWFWPAWWAVQMLLYLLIMLMPCREVPSHYLADPRAVACCECGPMGWWYSLRKGSCYCICTTWFLFLTVLSSIWTDLNGFPSSQAHRLLGMEWARHRS